MCSFSTPMSHSREDGVTIRNRLFGKNRKASLQHLGIALVLFVVIFGVHYLMRLFSYYPIPIAPSTAVVIVSLGLVASALTAYRNNGLIVSILLAISPPLSLVTAMEILELTYPRAPYWILVSGAVTIGVATGVGGYLLGVSAARLE